MRSKEKALYPVDESMDEKNSSVGVLSTTGESSAGKESGQRSVDWCPIGWGAQGEFCKEEGSSGVEGDAGRLCFVGVTSSAGGWLLMPPESEGEEKE